MIRRDSPRAGAPTHWLLIPQREHARLSYELAAAWQANPVACFLSDRPEVLEAIRLHDCGWSEWEASPKIDPAHSWPYGFTEMPPTEAQRIWSKSIGDCRDLGPLAGWIVAGHFIHLQSKQDDDYALWAPWLAKYQALQDAWLDEWKSQDTLHTERLAETGLFLLQTFDWLSLWLCCLVPIVDDDPVEKIELGDGAFGFGPLKLRGASDGVTVDPWPFAEDAPELSVDARRVPVANYSSTDELLAAAQTVTVDWKLARV